MSQSDKMCRKTRFCEKFRHVDAKTNYLITLILKYTVCRRFRFTSEAFIRTGIRLRLSEACRIRKSAGSSPRLDLCCWSPDSYRLPYGSCML